MDYMARALELARRAVGTASPNPPVGAEVVREGRVVGDGYTRPPGGDHAEVMALREAGASARGATLYTTLEPCNHTGRTPPCTRAILEAGIARVGLAMLDPNPLVNGAGMAELQRGGVAVQVGERGVQAGELYEAYGKFVRTGRPFVVAKFAASLDGKLATSTGDSRWITGEEARARANALRGEYDAVMVGRNTVARDDPQLTVRPPRGERPARQPLRVVVDGRGRTPARARLFRQPGDTVVAVGELPGAARARLLRAGAGVLEVGSGRGKRSVDLEELLRALGGRGVTGVLVEGGGRLLGSLFDLGLVDKVAAFIAPVIVGGSRATPAVAGEGVSRLARAWRLDTVRVEQVGRDIMVTGYPRRE